MKKNVGPIDRIVRIALLVVVGILLFMNMISGTLAIVLGILALILLATGTTGTCPAYLATGLSTNKGEG